MIYPGKRPPPATPSKSGSKPGTKPATGFATRSAPGIRAGGKPARLSLGTLKSK